MGRERWHTILVTENDSTMGPDNLTHRWQEMAFLEMMLMIVDFSTWKQMMKEAKAAKMAGKARP